MIYIASYIASTKAIVVETTCPSTLNTTVGHNADSLCNTGALVYVNSQEPERHGIEEVLAIDRTCGYEHNTCQDEVCAILGGC